MSALVLDAGALIAIEGADRQMLLRIRTAVRREVDLRTSAMVVAQVWRDPHGRQASLARLLEGVDVRPVDQDAGRAAGVLLARAGLADPTDAALALLARHGDRVVTSDPADLAALIEAAGTRALIVAC